MRYSNSSRTCSFRPGSVKSSPLSQRLTRWLGTSFALLALSTLTGCALFKEHQVVFVDGTDGFVRLHDDVKGHVWVYDATGKLVLSSKKVKLPPGWWAGRLPSAEDKNK